MKFNRISLITIACLLSPSEAINIHHKILDLNDDQGGLNDLVNSKSANVLGVKTDSNEVARSSE